MLDINLLRTDIEAVVARLQTRRHPQDFLDVAAFRALEAERKTLQTRTEALQAERNRASREIGQRKAKGESADALMAQVAALKGELDDCATRLDALQAELQALLQAVPNLPHESVPGGADETGNVERRGCTGRSRSSCSTCRPPSTATPSATRRTSSTPRPCSAPASCRSSRPTC